MIHLRLPSNVSRRLPFFLAMEEWAAMCLPAGEYFFTWVVNPTVIIGRNQDLMTEVDLDYCRRHQIDVCRRRSGGGCVYADGSNIMISYICPDTDVAATFGRYTGLVVDRLRAMGIDAEATGRNDVAVGGRKISGNAFYHLPGRSIVHGTMLFDIDMERMTNAITPSRAKLESNKVASVESRITMAREYCPSMTFDEFRSRLVSGLETGSVLLTDNDVAAIAAFENRYYEPGWLLRGASSGRGGGRQRRVDGVGMVDFVPVLDGDGCFDDIEVTGDAFVSDEFDDVVSRLKGCPVDAAAMAIRLADVDVSRYITGLSTERFIDLVLT